MVSCKSPFGTGRMGFHMYEFPLEAGIERRPNDIHSFLLISPSASLSVIHEWMLWITEWTGCQDLINILSTFLEKGKLFGMQRYKNIIYIIHTKQLLTMTLLCRHPTFCITAGRQRDRHFLSWTRVNV